MRKLLLAVVLAAAATLAVARPSNAVDKSTAPNKVVCRSQEVIGSRLQTKKTCMTAVQWDQYEREQRATVDRIQAFKPNNGQ